jgi:hypothetical protein
VDLQGRGLAAQGPSHSPIIEAHRAFSQANQVQKKDAR